MRSTAELEEVLSAAYQREAAAGDALRVRALCQGEETEVLDFLSARPLHTVYMAGFILDNGLVSPLNRGTFYGYRDHTGRLRGVALIGHATLIEARIDAALAAFARAADQTVEIELRPLLQTSGFGLCKIGLLRKVGLRQIDRLF